VVHFDLSDVVFRDEGGADYLTGGYETKLIADHSSRRLSGGQSDMNRKILCKIGVLTFGMPLLGCSSSEVSFSSDVQPIFEAHCIECHDSSGEGVQVSGFSVSNYDSVMKGTRFGQVVIPGSSISSTLYLVVAQKTAPEIQMPPHHTEAWARGRGIPLSERQVGIIRAWIDQGAQNN